MSLDMHEMSVPLRGGGQSMALLTCGSFIHQLLTLYKVLTRSTRELRRRQSARATTAFSMAIYKAADETQWSIVDPFALKKSVSQRRTQQYDDVVTLCLEWHW